MGVVQRHIGQHRVQVVDVAHSQVGIEVGSENRDHDGHRMNGAARRIGQPAIPAGIAAIGTPVRPGGNEPGQGLERIAGDRTLQSTARRGDARIHDPARLERLEYQVGSITERLRAHPPRDHTGPDIASTLLEQPFLHLLEQRDVGIELGRGLRIEQALLQQQRRRIEQPLHLGVPDLGFIDLTARRGRQTRRIEPRQRHRARRRGGDQIGRAQAIAPPSLRCRDPVDALFMSDLQSLFARNATASRGRGQIGCSTDAVGRRAQPGGVAARRLVLRQVEA